MPFLELAEKQLLRRTVWCCLDYPCHPTQSSDGGKQAETVAFPPYTWYRCSKRGRLAAWPSM